MRKIILESKKNAKFKEFGAEKGVIKWKDTKFAKANH